MLAALLRHSDVQFIDICDRAGLSIVSIQAKPQTVHSADPSGEPFRLLTESLSGYATLIYALLNSMPAQL